MAALISFAGPGCRAFDLDPAPPPSPTTASARQVPAPADLQAFTYREIIMGVEARITAYAPDEAAARAGARAAFARIRELDRVMSDYKPESELMRLVITPAGRPKPISDDLFDVLDLALGMCDSTDGAFDPTIGPVVELWRRARETGEMPPPEALAEARARTGCDKVELDRRRRTATLAVRGMRLDLGGIGKGYAAEQALESLRQLGLNQALVDLGGDIAIGDPPPGADAWRIRITTRFAPELDDSAGDAEQGEPSDQPDQPDDPPLRLANTCIATSGSAVQHIVIDGVRYSHIVDPRTGLGLTDDPAAVTVIHPDGAVADALASAMSVLGPDAGAQLARQRFPRARVIWSDD